MNESEKKEKMLKLLLDQATIGLDKNEQAELERLRKKFPDLADDQSFDEAAAAISLSTIEEVARMPDSLRAKITADAENYFADESSAVKAVKKDETASQDHTRPAHIVEEPKRPFWQWLTPVFAGVGCIALLASLWINNSRQTGPVVDSSPKPPVILTAKEKQEQLIASAKDLVKTAWTSPTKDKNLAGEVVWSDSKQQGFMRFSGLPVNDKAKETYQLWIFDETQDEKTPIDGGVFDIDKGGEVVVPIDAKLRVRNPKMFAVTVEKPGGVVVSKREKIVALAKT